MARFAVNYLLVKCGGQFKTYPDVRLFSRLTVTNLKPQIRMGLHSLAMGLWGWWAFDIFTLIASYMNTEAIAAQTIMRSIGLLTFMLPVGFASACSTLVGNAVGAGKSSLALKYYRTCLVLALSITATQFVILLTAREMIISTFTD